MLGGGGQGEHGEKERLFILPFETRLGGWGVRGDKVWVREP